MDANIGDPVCYEQLITLTTLPEEGGQLSLATDLATFMEHSRYTREQELKLKEEITYKSAWKILCFNQEDRLESSGMPVPANQLIFINHSMLYWGFFGHQRGIPSESIDNEAPLPEKNDSELIIT